MEKRPIKWQASLGALLACGPTTTVAADIYRSTHSDGSVRYASQALDPSYALYLKGESSPLIPGPSSNRLYPSRSAQQTALDPFIEQIAHKHAVDPALVRAVIAVESRFNPRAVSAKGAVGAMQLMPATAARYGVTSRADPAQNIEAGVRYLKDLLALHKGNVALALASYNAGEGAVARHGRRIPPYKETMLYVPAVLSLLEAGRSPTTP